MLLLNLGLSNYLKRVIKPLLNDLDVSADLLQLIPLLLVLRDQESQLKLGPVQLLLNLHLHPFNFLNTHLGVSDDE